MKTLLLIIVSLCTLSGIAAQERRWFLAGSFSAISNNNSTTNANNIAYTNNMGQSWFPLGSGTNGIINTVFVDTCSNVYIGGAFTSAGGISTNVPVAVWASRATNWSPVSKAPLALTSTSKSPVIYSITADCDAGCGSCKIYVGGMFGYTLSDGKIATGVMMFDNATSKWDALGGERNHRITEQDHVHVVSKKEHGVTEGPVNFLFVGGDFDRYLRYLNTSTGIWNEIDNSVDDPGYSVHSISYNDATLKGTRRQLYVGGHFNSRSSTGVTCSNLCVLDMHKWLLSPVLSSPVVGEIDSVSHSGTDLFVGGDFADIANQTLLTTFMTISDAGSNSQVLRTSTNITDQIIFTYACGPKDKNCTQGVVGMVSQAGKVSFFNKNTGTFSDLNTITNGVVKTFTSGFYSEQVIINPTHPTESNDTVKKVVGIIFIVIVLLILIIVFASLIYERYLKRKKTLRELNERQMREAEL
ncbi:hypothetical protein AKO1_007788 [Acrasis kona]|uniref:Galactose oxidase n=1 Tax=Acrasis kona TaxID=1008807 RepID=A0AAW2YQG1_9EUKA